MKNTKDTLNPDIYLIYRVIYTLQKVQGLNILVGIQHVPCKYYRVETIQISHPYRLKNILTSHYPHREPTVMIVDTYHML